MALPKMAAANESLTSEKGSRLSRLLSYFDTFLDTFNRRINKGFNKQYNSSKIFIR